jgi:hypothetical protein
VIKKPTVITDDRGRTGLLTGHRESSVIKNVTVITDDRGRTRLLTGHRKSSVTFETSRSR